MGKHSRSLVRWYRLDTFLEQISGRLKCGSCNTTYRVNLVAYSGTVLTCDCGNFIWIVD